MSKNIGNCSEFWKKDTNYPGKPRKSDKTMQRGKNTEVKGFTTVIILQIKK